MGKIISLFALSIFANCSLAQEYPFLRSVAISSTTTFERSDSIFFFNYVLTSSLINKGNIIRFEIDISRSQESVLIDTIGLRFENDGLAEPWFREDYPRLKDKIVAVSVLSSPGRWTGSFSNALTIAWFGHPLIPPGGALSDYQLMSKGIPGIRRCIVSPRFDVDSLFPSIEDTTATMSIAQMDSIREAVNYHGWTIGPTAPPINFVPTTWLDTLLSYTRQSVTLGWLKSNRDNDCDGDEKPQDGVSKNLEKRLNKVRTELTKGNNLKASKELEKFIKKIERVSKRSEVMTSEAYALLKYNAEYLLSHIITLPARPTGTVLQQIDELKAELTRQSSKKNIGGVLLVKSLTFLADQAKKQLQKPLPSTNDSATAALSLAAFQLVVDDIWESTEALAKKNKKFLTLYVYDEAYIQLHYRAKYILESLPAPRTLIDMKSVQMDDEMRKELDAMQKMSKAQ